MHFTFKVKIDESVIETSGTKSKSMALANLTSPTMSVLDQAKQQNNVVFNPSQMDLSATMSLAHSLNNLGSCPDNAANHEPAPSVNTLTPAEATTEQTQPKQQQQQQQQKVFSSYEAPVVSVVKEQDTALAQTMLNMIIPSIAPSVPEVAKETPAEQAIQRQEASQTQQVQEPIKNEPVIQPMIPQATYQNANKNLGNLKYFMTLCFTSKCAPQIQVSVLILAFLSLGIVL